MALNNWLKDAGGRKWEGIMLPPQSLTLDPTNRGGVDTPETLAWIEVIADSIEREGFDPGQPVAFRRVDGKMLVRDGHMRTRAALIVQARGKPLELIPCIQLTNVADEAQELTWQVRRNQKLEHTRENHIQIVDKLRLWGWSDERICTGLQRSRTWLDNLMLTASAPAAVQEMIRAKVVSPTEVARVMRKRGDDAAAALQEASEAAKAAGKLKVTRRTVDAVRVPRVRPWKEAITQFLDAYDNAECEQTVKDAVDRLREYVR